MITVDRVAADDGRRGPGSSSASLPGLGDRCRARTRIAGVAAQAADGLFSCAMFMNRTRLPVGNVAAYDGLQPGDVAERYVLLVDRYQFLALEHREQSAHRLKRQTEVAADLFAGHPQVEFPR